MPTYDRYWVGGPGSKSASDTANWSATRNGAGGASVPTSNEAAAIIDGTSNISTGLNLSALTGTIDINFNGTIGSGESTGLKTNCQRVTVGGSSSFVNIETGSAGGVTQLDVYGMNGGTCRVLAGGSGVGTVYVGGDCVYKHANTASSTIYNGGGGVIISSNTAGTTVLHNYAGNAICSGNITTINEYGGVVTVAASATVNAANVYGGLYIHNSSGTIASMNVFPNGTATDSGATSAFTVTASVIWVGGSLFESPGVSITYTAATVHRGFP